MKAETVAARPVSYEEYLRAKGLEPLPSPHTQKNPGDVIIGAKGMIVVRAEAA